MKTEPIDTPEYRNFVVKSSSSRASAFLFFTLLALFIVSAAVFGPQTVSQEATRTPEVSEAQDEAASNKPLEDFVPTEELSADSEISFPVDI